jgi:pimeloyl-ACP methyl ester carboxylesterase
VRPDLYDFYVQENLYPEIFKNVEVKIEVGPDFPKCVLLHGNNDPDGPMALSEQFVTEVGQNTARLVVVDGAGHCFDDGYFLEDDVVEMRAVADAWRILDDVVNGKWR